MKAERLIRVLEHVDKSELPIVAAEAVSHMMDIDSRSIRHLLPALEACLTPEECHILKNEIEHWEPK